MLSIDLCIPKSLPKKSIRDPISQTYNFGDVIELWKKHTQWFLRWNRNFWNPTERRNRQR